LSLRRHRLLAPDLLTADCANVLGKKMRRREISEGEAVLAARLLARADIELEPMRGCDFVTADETLSRKALPPGHERKIILLSGIGLA
ncbi:MAG: type II toxin-antitoxin system VapC family toxin, partial [Stellaceae bacterium]